MKKTIFFLFLGLLVSCKLQDAPSSFTDARDDQVYKTVTIGNQVWMAENLKYFPDPGNGMWIYDDQSTTSSEYETYGVLYDWATAMGGASSSSANPSGVQGVCPEGWHLPGDAEWEEFATQLGGEGAAGGKMKEAGTAHWTDPNTGATNESGFTALPGGNRRVNGTYFGKGNYGSWWSATQEDADLARRWYVSHNNLTLTHSAPDKEVAFSVRCVKD